MEVVCHEAEGRAEVPSAFRGKEYLQTLSISDLERHHDPIGFAAATEWDDVPTLDCVAWRHRGDFSQMLDDAQASFRNTGAAERGRYARGVAHYIFNLVGGDASQATGLLRARMWGIGTEEPHRDALAPGDLALVYLAAPERKFIAGAALASAVHDWTPPEERVYPGDSSGGVLLAHVEEWDPPVPMSAVLSQIDRSAGARADFEVGVVRITADEYETALALAAERRTSAG